MLEEADRVAMRDLVDLCIGQVLDRIPQVFRNVGPQGIRMRVVAFIGDHVLADLVKVAQAEAVIDEAVQEVPLHKIAGLHVLEPRMRPGLVAPVGKVRALHEIGHPADAAFRNGDAQLRVLVQFFKL